MQLIVVQTIVPDYRVEFFAELTERVDCLTLLCGNSYFEKSVATSPDVRIRLRNRFLLKRRLLWQSGVLGKCFGRASVVVLEMNPRIITNWIILFGRRIMRSHTVLWGHAWARSGPASQSEPARRLMRALAHATVVYTDSQKQDLLDRYPAAHVFSAPNAIYHRADSVVTTDSLPLDILCVGRLVEAKRPALLLDAFTSSVANLPSTSCLVFVGDGPMRRSLEDAVPISLRRRVRFLGHVSDRKQLAELYGMAAVAVSPGYVGLNLIQSLFFGVPFLYADDEPHAPEIEAARSDYTKKFRARDVTDLSTCLIEIFGSSCAGVYPTRKAIAAETARLYCVERMAEGFIGALSFPRAKRRSH